MKKHYNANVIDVQIVGTITSPCNRWGATYYVYTDGKNYFTNESDDGNHLVSLENASTLEEAIAEAQEYVYNLMIFGLPVEVFEDNDGGLYLAYLKGGKCVYFHGDYGQRNERGCLIEDLFFIYNGSDPAIDEWRGNEDDPDAAYNSFLDAIPNGGATIVANECGLYPRRMGAAASREFGISVQ